MTVILRRLSKDEAAHVFPARQGQDISEYLQALEPVVEGDVVEVPLNGLSTRALKRRFGAAAKKQDKVLRWSSRNTDEALYFRVEAAKPVVRRRRRSRLLSEPFVETTIQTEELPSPVSAAPAPLLPTVEDAAKVLASVRTGPIRRRRRPGRHLNSQTQTARS